MSGGLYVFTNRRGNYLKGLFFDRTGFCIWAKRLERGVFVRRHAGGLKRSMSYTDLKLPLEGIELKDVRRRPRFSLKEKAQRASHRSACSI